MQIAFSSTIRECDVVRLTNETESHLNGIVHIFEKKLLPKHHIITHYPNIIRKMGPPQLMWTKRYEAKHKEFTDMAKKTNNFINIAKSLAQKHQEILFLNGFEAKSAIIESKTFSSVNDNKELKKYAQILKCRNLDESIVLNFLIVDSNQYREGIILINNCVAYEIRFVLKKSDEYFFICKVFDKIEFRECFNAIELKQSITNGDIQVLELNEISNKTSYQMHYINGQVIVICNTLDVYNKF